MHSQFIHHFFGLHFKLYSQYQVFKLIILSYNFFYYISHYTQNIVKFCSISNCTPNFIQFYYIYYITFQVVWRRMSPNIFLTIGEKMYAEIEEMSVDVTRLPKYDRVQTDLIIKHAQPSHSGLYECQISSTKIYNYIVQLNVLGKYGEGSRYWRHQIGLFTTYSWIYGRLKY